MGWVNRMKDEPRGRSCLALLVATATVLGSVPARAQGQDSGAAAEALFQEGRKLVDAKRYGEACPKLLASHRLAPAPGTLLNLADCYERDGKLASAWARFREAISLAQKVGRPDREKSARQGADRLEPRLIKLTILAKEPGVEVKLDGTALDAAALGTPVPVDAGKHTIDASARGKKTFSTAVDVSERTKAPSVEIPPLDAEDPTAPAAKKPATPPTVTEPPAEEPKSRGGLQRVLGITAMGIGVVGLGIGTFYGIRAIQKSSEAKDAGCNDDNECQSADGQLAAETAQNAGTFSTIMLLAGGVFAAGGVVLYLTAPKNPVKVGVGPGSLTIGGVF